MSTAVKFKGLKRCRFFGPEVTLLRRPGLCIYTETMKRLVTFSTILVALLSSSNALAWADLGHSIVGAVAEQTIKPETKDYIRGLMGVEPLAVAAIFPDHVRDDERFGHKEADASKRADDNHDFGDYHFCEIPVGYTYDTKPKKDVKDCYGAIAGSIAILKNEKAAKPEKQIALRYLAHVIGDIMQPRHVGNGFDLGGNACQVTVQESPDRNPMHTNLHSFWDDGIVGYLGTTYADPVQKIGNAKYLNQYIAAFQRLRPEMLTDAAKAKYGAGSPKDWMLESQAIREGGLYPDAPGSMAGVKTGEEAKNRPYCLWFEDQATSKLGAGSQVDKDKIPVIDLAYEKKFAPIVESQLLKAGLRLAAVLDDIAASQPKAAKMNDASQEAALSNVQNLFRSAGAAEIKTSNANVTKPTNKTNNVKR
jgi:hypothetical protein